MDRILRTNCGDSISFRLRTFYTRIHIYIFYMYNTHTLYLCTIWDPHEKKNRHKALLFQHTWVGLRRCHGKFCSCLFISLGNLFVQMRLVWPKKEVYLMNQRRYIPFRLSACACVPIGLCVLRIYFSTRFTDSNNIKKKQNSQQKENNIKIWEGNLNWRWIKSGRSQAEGSNNTRTQYGPILKRYHCVEAH